MNHLQKYLVDEFVEDYQEGLLSRRQALKRIAGITGAALAVQILAACGQAVQTAATPATGAATTSGATSAPEATSGATSAPEAATSAPEAATSATSAPEAATAAPATAATAPAASAANSVAADDPAISAQMIEFPGGDGQLMAYMARPAGSGAFPIVLVCHENRGLTPHIEDVTRRVAKAGYVGLAVDLLSREGGTAKVADQDSVPGLLSGAPPERHVQDFKSGLEYVKSQPFAKADSAGMVGFCFGGGVTWLVAAGIPELKAAVPFYGPPPPADNIPKVNAAVLAIYAEKDNRITGTIAAVEPAMEQAGKTYKKIIYPGVDHAFNNDTGPRYNAEAALAAWDATLAWFKQYLAA